MTTVIISPPAFANLPQTWYQATIFSSNTVIDDPNFKNFNISESAAQDDKTLLNTHIVNNIGSVPVGQKLIVIGHSRGSQIIYKWLRETGPSSSVDPTKILFISGGNPERKYNGATAVDPDGHPATYPGTQPWGNGYGVPVNTPYTVLDIARQYDQWADHPGDLSNSAAHTLANGSGVHTAYGAAPELGADGYPANWNEWTVVAAEGNITYIVSPTFPGDSTPTQSAYTTSGRLFGVNKRRQDEDYGHQDLSLRQSIEKGFRRPAPPPNWPKPPNVPIKPPPQWRYISL